jgi:two-component system nitrogen regulation response regulator NtrX
MKLQIVIVDDESRIRSTLQALLDDEGYSTLTFGSGEEALDYLKGNSADVLFLDVMLPGIDGLEMIPRVRELLPSLRILMMSGHADVEIAVKAARLGAYNFFEKPLNPDQILLALANISEQIALEQRMASLEDLIEQDSAIIGASPPVKRLQAEIAKAGPSEGRVMIFGENGTGKELVARSIHRLSGRNGPFISLNCAALPEQLVESELFGYEKGAFTGAVNAKPGRFELADAGTLFLDEVGDMGLETQAKLLRVLEEKEAVRLGGSKSYSFNVRVISATNKDLKSEIEAGRFREDLYYRLNVIPLICPPLRERKDDISLLARHFLNRICSESAHGMKEWGKGAIEQLIAYGWPGNIRELKNFVERLVIMVPSNIIEAEDVLAFLPVPRSEKPILDQAYSDRSFREQVEGFERELLNAKYREYSGNVSEMARQLKMDRSNLHRKLKQYGIK